MFEVLGVRPIVGRTFREGEDRPDAPRVAVLGSGVWRDLFASDPGVVGRTVVLDGSPTEIIGVVPDYAAVPENSRLWVPLRIDPDESPRFAHWLNTIGRLAPGVSIAEANAELALVASRLEVEYPDTNEDRGFEVVALRDERSEDVASITLVLFGAVGFLLLIVCANVASLLLARASSREREIGIRAAIGASRTRLVRQLVTETLLLAGAGAVLGFGLSLLGTRAIVATVPGGLPPWMSVAPDARVLGFLLLVSLVAALAAGLAPAWKASRPDLRTAISGGLRGGDRRTTQRGRRALVAAELAVSVTLLIGAGLMVRSFVRLTSVEPGFTTENRLTARMALPRGKYDSEAKRIEFVRDMSEQIRAVPGVREVAVVDRMPLGGSSNRMTVFVEGQTREEFDNNPAVLVNVAGPGYFTAMGIPRLRGRGILATDDSASARVAVISEDMADRLWPGEDPIGRRFTFSDPPEWIEVVGVVGGVRHHGLDDRPIPHAYLAYAQNASTRMSVVIRAAGEPSTLVAAVREAIRRADSDVAPADEMPLTELVEASTWQAGFFTRLFWVFGLIALILAAVGVYGVVSFAVAQRTREFGIRRALGAETHRLLRLVLRDAGVVVLIGLLLGLAGSLALSRVLAGFLYEISPTDPLTFAAVAGFLAATALLAAWMPARRASRVDPIVALREE